MNRQGGSPSTDSSGSPDRGVLVVAEKPAETAVIGEFFDEIEGLRIAAAQDGLPERLPVGRPVEFEVVDGFEFLFDQRHPSPVLGLRKHRFLGVRRIGFGNKHAAACVESSHPSPIAAVAEHDRAGFTEEVRRSPRGRRRSHRADRR